MKSIYSSLVVMSVLALAVLTSGHARAEVLNRVVAVVNDDMITSYQLQQRLATLPEEQRKESASAVLERMVEELLLQQRAKEIGVDVSDEEIDAAISDIQVQNRLTLELLEQALQGQGLTLAAYRENLRSEILRYKLLGREVKAKADVTTQELRNYYEEHRNDYLLPPTVSLGVVNVNVPKELSSEGVQLLRAKAEKVRVQMDESVIFDELLGQLGKDPDLDGSALGAIAEDELSPLFATAVRDVPVGGVSDILETPAGLALLKVLDRSKGGARPFDEVRAEIEAVVQERKTEELFDAWKKGLRKEAQIDIRL